MINEIINNIEPTQAMLPAWLVASIVINGGKIISEAFSGDDDDSKNDDDYDCHSSYNPNAAWVEQCKEIRRAYNPVVSEYRYRVTFEDMAKVWEGCTDPVYCSTFPDIPVDLGSEMISNFDISEDEMLLFVYDDSFWGTRKKGVCITDQSIYLITNSDDPHQSIIINWASISEVCYDRRCLYFIGYNENFVAIPDRYFSTDRDKFKGEEAAQFLSVIANATQSINAQEEGKSEENERIERAERTTITPYISPQEREYIDELKACMTPSGDIRESDLRLLKSLQGILGISDSRAIELATSIDCNFTLSRQTHKEDDLQQENVHIETICEDEYNKAVMAFENYDYSTAWNIFSKYEDSISLNYMADMLYENKLSRWDDDCGLEDYKNNRRKAMQLYERSAKMGNIDSQFTLGRIYSGVDDCRIIEVDQHKSYEWYRTAAEQGYAPAQYIVGTIFELGDGVEQSNESAIEWYKKAAEQGDLEAQASLGRLYYEDGDYNRASEWLVKAAEQGVLDAYYDMGRLYIDQEEYSTAFEWLNKAIEQGHADSTYLLGCCYYEGRGVAVDKQVAINLYKKSGSAEAQYKLGLIFKYDDDIKSNPQEAYTRFAWAGNGGHPYAQYFAGLCFDIGEGVKQNRKSAKKWYRLAATNGVVEAQSRLGEMYYEDKNYEQAIKWLIKAAEQGDIDAQHCLGEMYCSCEEVEKNDAESFKWYMMAAEQGSAGAQYIAATFLELGDGVEQSREKAMELYQKSAEQGLAHAQSRLGVLLYDDKEYEQAVKWLVKAVEQEDVAEINTLGCCYADGKGVDLDYDRALELFLKAAEAGSIAAIANIGECYEKRDKDYPLAIEWYQKALNEGFEPAAEAIKRCEALLNSNNNCSQSSITPNEQEYLDEYKLCLEDGGDITSSERRLLNRLRDRFNITEERAMQLEQLTGSYSESQDVDDNNRLLSIMNIVESVVAKKQTE